MSDCEYTDGMDMEKLTAFRQALEENPVEYIVQTLYCRKFQSIERLFTSLLTLFAAKIGVLEGPLVAGSSYRRR